MTTAKQDKPSDTPRTDADENEDITDALAIILTGRHVDSQNIGDLKAGALHKIRLLVAREGAFELAELPPIPTVYGALGHELVSAESYKVLHHFTAKVKVELDNLKAKLAAEERVIDMLRDTILNSGMNVKVLDGAIDAAREKESKHD